MKEKQPAVYIVANKKNGTLYTGVTSCLTQRIHQHKTGAIAGFSSRYDCKILVYYELAGTMEQAILREKQIKAGSRASKLKLVEALNPDWDDLYNSLF